MKKIVVLILVLSLMVVAGSAFADVANSRHNLSASGIFNVKTNDPDASVCGFCHIPHGGDITIAGVPLWARNLAGLAGTYVVYGGTVAGGTGTTLAGTTVNQPAANSLTCLSCHDGTVALGVTFKNGIQTSSYAMTSVPAGYVVADKLSYTGYATSAAYGPGGTVDPGYNPVIGGNTGTDLTNDHPVGIVYTAGAAGLAPIATPQGVGLTFYDYGAGLRVECGSCHNPHNTVNGAFLRRPAANICQDCHANQ